MSLIPGTRIGVYQITAQIGVGGMGEVYQATDTNLKRQVAIKVLPASVAGDADRLARFQREAEVLAALNHPNIAAIYGLEESRSVDRSGGSSDPPTITALVMELVEGDDLSQRIAQGAIPLDEALPIAKQIAEALEAAHEQGIIHRDLKPANIKVRPDGTVKVLDFGLAKAIEQGSGIRDRGSVELANSPTLTTPAMTQAGMILGTAAYMAPEQARGKTVDKRADIWAFGVVLFEMLTGQRAFGGEDIAQTLANVINKEPAWEALPPATPVRIRSIVARCLVKDPRQRLRDMGDVRLALEGAFETIAPHAAVSATQAMSVWSRALPWAVAGAALIVAGATALLGTPWLAEKPADRPLVRLDVDLGADVSLPAPSSSGSSVAISPDGARLVYASGSPTRLFIRRLDQPKAVELPGTQGARVPFFSPDSQWVGFVSGGKANKTSVEGGAVVPLADLSGVTFADWGADGSIFMWASQKLLRIPAGGGPTETLAEPRAGELGMYGSQLLPGGKAVLLTVDNPGPIDRNTIDVVTLADHQRKTVLRGAASARYLASPNGAGHLVYVTQATLFAIPFDLNTLATRGTAVPVVDDVAYENTTGVGQFEVSRTGTLVYRRAIAGAAALRTLQWVDIEGKKEPLRATPATYQELKLSPDGKRIALSVIDGASEDVWVYDPQRDAMTRLTSGGEAYRYPVWSPDGQHVVFAWVGHGMFQTRADGASQPLPLTASTAVQYPWSFSPDGKRLAYHELAGTRQLWTVQLQDDDGRLKAGTPEPFLKSGSNDVAPSFSPDGRWLAYQSNESGTNEVYVRAFSPASASFPGSAGQGGPSTSLRTGKWQISNAGGTQPRWSPSGHGLIYQSGDQLMAAGYTVSGDTFVAEKPRVWMAKIGAGENYFGSAAWDLAPDGKRVVVAVPVESSEAPKQEHAVVFLQNFVDELSRRVPLGK